MKIADFCKKNSDVIIGGAILLGIYLLETAIRPLTAPGEFRNIALLRTLLGELPVHKLYFRLPAVAATFIGAIAIFLLARNWNFKRPGAAAGFYLLFPPVFYSGTAISGAPILCAGVLSVICGVIIASKSKKILKRLCGILPALPVAAAALFYLESPFFCVSDWWMLIIPALTMLFSFGFDRMDQDSERTKRAINRFAFGITVVLVLTAILIWMPVLLRHFKVNFPEELALYGRNERIIRPMLLLLIPLIWLTLARNSGKTGKKLLMLGGAMSFFLLILPITLPWQIQKNLYPEYLFKQFVKVLPPGKCVALVEAADAPFFNEILDFPVMKIGDAQGETAPGNLAAETAKLLKSSNVLLICSNRELEKHFPHLAGKRYVVSKYHIFCYYNNNKVVSK